MKKITLLLAMVLLFVVTGSYGQIAFSDGWEDEDAPQWTTDYFSLTTFEPCGGTNSPRVNIYSSNPSASLVSPNLGFSNAGLLTVGFNYRVADWGTDPLEGSAPEVVNLEVQWSQNAEGPWTTISTVNSTNHVTSDACAAKSFTFTPPAGNVYIRFLASYIEDSDGDVYYYIDDFTANQGAAPPCVSPTAAVASLITKNSATVSWTASISTPTGGYAYYSNTTGVAPTAGTTPTGTVPAGTTSTNLTALASSTTYYVWLRSSCGTDGNSDWIGPLAFSTLCNYGDVLTSTASPICGQGEADLAATASPNAVINWYTTPTGGNRLATGASVTSPEINETTSFYVTAGNVNANENVSVGAGEIESGSTGYSPYYHGWGGAKTQYIIRAADLQAAGVYAGPINSLAFTITDAADLTYNDFAIHIGTTTQDAATTTHISGLTPVYSNAAQAVTNGLNVYTFTAPFVWNGTSNIVVQTCYSNINFGGTSSVVESDVTAYASATITYADNRTAAEVCGTSTGAVANADGATSGNTIIESARAKITFNATALCESPRVAVVATVTPAPAITVEVSDASICVGQSTDLSVESTNADYTYVWTPGNLSGADHTVTPATTTTYTVTATDAVSGCVTESSVTVTVNALPVSTLPAATAVCEGTAQALTVNTNASITFGTGTTAPGTTSYPNPFSAYYGGLKTQILFTEQELLAQGLIVGGTIKTLSFDFNASSDKTLNDFRIKIGSTTNATTTGGFVSSATLTTVYNATYTPTAGVTGYVPFTLTTPFVYNGGNLIVEIAHNQGNGGNGSGTRNNTTTTSFDSVISGATDNVTPSGMASYDALTTYGTGSASNLRPNTRFGFDNNSNVIWTPVTNLYTDAAATVAYTGQSAVTVYAKPTAAVTYTATVTNLAGCVLVETTDVTITVTPAPAVVSATVEICNAGTIANLAASVTGTGVKWYADATGGTALASTAALVDDTTYYASQTVGGCESTARTAVSVNITVVAAPAIANAAPAFCNAATVADLLPNGADIKWYAAATGGTALAPTTALVSGTPYYASQTVNGCESLLRGTVTPTINVVAAPVIADDTQVFCNAATVADLMPNDASIKWYAAATGGTALLATDALVSGTPYYASQTVNGCEGLLRGTVTPTINVVAAPVVADDTQVFCNAATVADLMPNDASIKWYAAATGGTALLATDALISGTPYYASQTVDGCEGLVRAMVTATVTVTAVPTGDNEQEFCGAATVADLTADGDNIAWYAAATNGTVLAADTALADGTVYYASQTIDGCESLTRFAVTADIHTVAVDAPADVNVCAEYVLPALTSGAYFTATGGQGTEVAAGTAVTETTTLYVYAQEGTDVVCFDENTFTITVANVPAPTGSATQTISVEAGTDATIADLVTDSTVGTVTWYATEEDAQAGVNALAADAVVESGATYYATQTVGDCTSEDILAVLVDVVLGRNDFDVKAFTYHPNPVKDIINLSYTSEITSVTVFNLLGQQVISQAANATEVKVDMSSLADGAYIVNVTSGSTVKTIKVIKRQ